MSSRRNVNEILWVAINVLVTSGGSLQDRLASAGKGLVGVYLPPNSDLPKKHQEALESIIHDLTKGPAKGGEGGIRATTRNMTDQEAEHLAERILSLYAQLKCE